MYRSPVLVATVVLGVLVCAVVGRSLPGATRVRRASSDQRIAELQALIALSKGGSMVGHGQFDPNMVGKRKRAEEYVLPSEMRRLRLLQRIMSNLEDQDS